MTPAPFRFVLVGSGGISRAYAQSIAHLAPTAELVAVVSRSGRRPGGVSEKLPVFPDLASVTVPFDGVALATPNGAHRDGALAAAALGKHVVCEKVLAATRADMDAMIDACAAAGVTLAVTYQRRASPDNVALKRLLESGRLGRVFGVDMEVKFYRDAGYYGSAAYRGTRAMDGGGAYMQQAAHNADLLCWYFGMPDRVVSMLARRVHSIEVEDHGAALLHYPDGMIATFTASTVCRPGLATRLSLHAEAGTLVLENDRIVLWRVEGIENPTDPNYAVHDGATSATVSDTAGHEAILRDFIEAARTGREPLASGRAARDATELILRIYESDVLGLAAKEPPTAQPVSG
jgi:predicted dehydrogenase